MDSCTLALDYEMFELGLGTQDSIHLAAIVVLLLGILGVVNHWIWKAFFSAGKFRFKARLRVFLFGEILWAGIILVFAPVTLLTLYYIVTSHGISWTSEFILMLAFLIVVAWVVVRVIWLIIISLPWLTVGLILASSFLLLK